MNIRLLHQKLFSGSTHTMIHPFSVCLILLAFYLTIMGNKRKSVALYGWESASRWDRHRNDASLPESYRNFPTKLAFGLIKLTLAS